MSEQGSTGASVDATAMGRLRLATHKLHVTAERSPFAYAMIFGQLTRAEYARLLTIMRALHAKLEPALLASGDARVRAFGALVPPKLPLLDRDLAALAEPAPPMWPALEAAIAAIERHVTAAAIAGVPLLGALYTMEGATNGGQFLALRLAQNPAIPAGALSYYRGYGEETHTRWRAFTDRMNQDLSAPAEQELVIEAARGLFDHLQAIFNELGHHLEQKR